MSFQKRVDENLKQETTPPRISSLSSQQSKIVRKENNAPQYVSDADRAQTNAAALSNSTPRSQSSGALQAAAAAAKNGPPSPQPPPRNPGLENLGTAVRNAELRRPIPRTPTTRAVELAAVKTSVQRSNTIPTNAKFTDPSLAEKGNISRSSSSVSMANVTTDTSNSSTSRDNRGAIAASAAKLSSVQTQIPVPDKISATQLSSTQAARTCIKQKTSNWSSNYGSRQGSEVQCNIVSIRVPRPRPQRTGHW